VIVLYLLYHGFTLQSTEVRNHIIDNFKLFPMKQKKYGEMKGFMIEYILSTDRHINIKINEGSYP